MVCRNKFIGLILIIFGVGCFIGGLIPSMLAASLIGILFCVVGYLIIC